MVPTGAIIERVQAAIGDKSNETKVDIRNHLNAAYYSIANSRPWTNFTKQETVTSTLLPADMIYPIYAQDDTSELYFRIGFPQRYFSQKLYNYFINLSVTTPLLTGTDLATTINSVTVTSATGGFTAAMVGEYIRIGTNKGIYKIATRSDTNTITLTEKFRGADWTDPDTPANLTAQYFEVRPVGTKNIALTDENGAAITTSTFLLWYLAQPLPLYNDYDMILLPGDCEALYVKVCRLMLETEKYENDSLRRVPDFEIEMSKMQQLDPIPEKFITPRDRQGMRLMFGRNRTRNPQSIHSERYF